MFFLSQDNDANHHIDWITSATNLRCKNYHIKETTRQKVRTEEIVRSQGSSAVLALGWLLHC